MNTEQARKAVEWGKSHISKQTGRPYLFLAHAPHIGAIVKATPAQAQQSTQGKVSCPGCDRIVDVVTFGNVRTYARHNISSLSLAMGGPNSVRCNISGKEVINRLKALA